MTILKQLGIGASNPGVCYGPGKWGAMKGRATLVSQNPSTSQPLARVMPATTGDYAKVIAAAHGAFTVWRAVPSPRFGALSYHV